MISIEEFYLLLKENKKNFTKKNHEFVDSEFVKTCHKHVRRVWKLINYLSSPRSLLTSWLFNSQLCVRKIWIDMIIAKYIVNVNLSLCLASILHRPNNFSIPVMINFINRISGNEIMGCNISPVLKVIIHKSHDEHFLWNRNWDLGWFLACWHYCKNGLIISNFWGQFFYVFMGKKDFFFKIL